MNKPVIEQPAIFHLVTHKLCPYVQRSIIVLVEKNARYRRTDIDLADPPAWFSRVSPLGRTPVLLVEENDSLFESAVICEYINDVTAGDLHPGNPLEKARHRAWIEFGSNILDNIWRLYSAQGSDEFETQLKDIRARFAALEDIISAEPYFSGNTFHLVDGVYGPIFRYFDVLDQYIQPQVLRDMPKVNQWRRSLAKRDSVRKAVSAQYPQWLTEFLVQRNSYLSTIITRTAVSNSA